MQNHEEIATVEHYFELEFPAREIRVKVGNQVIASSFNTIMLKEKGWKLYDPVYYFPISDVTEKWLSPSDHSTFCPIKGYTQYMHLELPDEEVENIAWAYVDTIENAAVLKDMLAFDSELVTIEISPLIKK